MRFPTIVRGDQVAMGKPAPDVFIEAGRQLAVAAAHCVVFEDAPMGITAARAAAMPVVAVTTTFTADQFAALDDTPDLVVRDFDDYLARIAW